MPYRYRHVADPRLATSWVQIEALPAHGALYQHTPEVAIAIGLVDGLVCGAHVLTTAGQQCVSEVLSALEPLRITSRGTNVSDGNMTCADDADWYCARVVYWGARDFFSHPSVNRYSSEALDGHRLTSD